MINLFNQFLIKILTQIAPLINKRVKINNFKDCGNCAGLEMIKSLMKKIKTKKIKF